MYYMDREGHRTKKTTSQDKFLKFVYTHTATRVLMRPFLLPAISRLGGKLLNTKVSAVFAGLFARTHGIDLNKYEKQKFEFTKTDDSSLSIHHIQPTASFAMQSLPDIIWEAGR